MTRTQRAIACAILQAHEPLPSARGQGQARLGHRSGHRLWLLVLFAQLALGAALVTSAIIIPILIALRALR